tara:strand:+ start:1735 stop:2127 length:393 start_codon:yes stop_codon:yes gene_type:complete
MAEQTIYLPRQNYPSLQVGDKVYKLSAPNDQSVNFTQFNGSPEVVGDIINIQDGSVQVGLETTLATVLTVDVEDDVPNVETTDYLFFQKDNKYNTSSLVGYYGSATFENNSQEKAELYSAACEVSQSSKS